MRPAMRFHFTNRDRDVPCPMIVPRRTGKTQSEKWTPRDGFEPSDEPHLMTAQHDLGSSALSHFFRAWADEAIVAGTPRAAQASDPP